MGAGEEGVFCGGIGQMWVIEAMIGLGRVMVGRIDGVVCVCKRVFSVGFGPGLDSMSPARSRRWVAGPLGRQDRWVQFAQTVAHQPRAGCIRLVPHLLFFSSINLSTHYIDGLNTVSCMLY